MVKYTKALIHCGWCGHTFKTEISSTDGARSQVKCMNCGRLLPSSIIIRSERGHTHKPYPIPKLFEK